MDEATISVLSGKVQKLHEDKKFTKKAEEIATNYERNLLNNTKKKKKRKEAINEQKAAAKAAAAAAKSKAVSSWHKSRYVIIRL